MLIYRLCKFHANLVAMFAGKKEKRRRKRKQILDKYALEFLKKPQNFDLIKIQERTQDIYFPLDLESAERIIIILVPELNAMSGGIYSMFSIAAHLRRMKPKHGYDVVIMTRPNKQDLTYFRNSNFINSENVYRFSQIERLKNVKEIYLQIPEYATVDFVDNLTDDEFNFLSHVKKLDINILNQNIKLMPEEEKFRPLRRIADSVTQSVAHHAYFSQKMADKYDLPTLLLPAYTDLSNYPKTSFEEKKKLIIYSPDSAPFKEAVLNKIRKNLPEFQLLEIKDITFDKYMEYATDCMFSISFGEGFDGYVAQPIYQGGLGLTVYNEDFFPSKKYKDYPVFFETSKAMQNEICEKILYFSKHPDAYKKLNRKIVEEFNKLYNYDEYVEQIRKLADKKFEIFPSQKLK